MEDYVQKIKDEELIQLMRVYLLEHEVLNCPIRQIAGNTYFFDSNEIYSLDKGSTAFPYSSRLKFHTFKVMGVTSFNANVWNKAAKQFSIGMSLADCIRIFLYTSLDINPTKELPYIERLIQSVEGPEYERMPENFDEKTFDRIRVRVCLPRYMFQTWDELKIAVRENRSEIDRRVLDKIKSDRKFKNFGLPVNFIKASDVTLLRDYTLEYIFEIKGEQSPI